MAHIDKRTLLIGCLLALAACQEEQTLTPCAEGACGSSGLTPQLGELGRYASMAIHEDGRIVVGSYDATHGNLVARVENPLSEPTTHLIAGWSTSEKGSVARDSGRWSSVATDSQGDSHFAWYETDRGALGYASLSPQGVVSSQLVDGESEGNRGTHTSIAVDADGRVFIAYRDVTARSLRLATREPGEESFIIETIDGCADEPDCPLLQEDYGEYASLVLVASQPRIAFYDRARGDLKMALRDEGTWQVLTLDGRDSETGEDTGDVGRFASAAIDTKQRLGVAYFNATLGELRYLSPDGTTPHPIVVDRGTYLGPHGATRSHVVGQHVALAYDAQDAATLVYLDAGLLKLRQARVYGQTPTTPEVLIALPPGAYMDLERDSTGGLHLAYGAWQLGEQPTTTLETATLTWGLDR